MVPDQYKAMFDGDCDCVRGAVHAKPVTKPTCPRLTSRFAMVPLIHVILT